MPNAIHTMPRQAKAGQGSVDRVVMTQGAHQSPPQAPHGTHGTDGTQTSQGPNVKRLIIYKVSLDAVPSDGDLTDAVKFLSNKEAMFAGIARATEWVNLAILTIRQASEPNPWKHSNDEVIAGEVLRQITAKTRSGS